MVLYDLEPFISTDGEALSHLLSSQTHFLSLRITESLRHPRYYSDDWIYRIYKRSKRYGRHILLQYDV